MATTVPYYNMVITGLNTTSPLGVGGIFGPFGHPAAAVGDVVLSATVLEQGNGTVAIGQDVTNTFNTEPIQSSLSMAQPVSINGEPFITQASGINLQNALILLLMQKG